MKIRKDIRSPWGKRIYFEDREFELMMDELLRRTGERGFEDGAGVNVDLVLLKSLGVEADYATLPEDVLGRVLVGLDGSMEIQISRELADEAEINSVSRRRLRTTLGHECGHVVCHRPLFITDTATLSLFGKQEKTDEKPAAILCRDSSVGKTNYNGEWWEYQANQCMVQLLLPRKLFTPRVNQQLELYKLSAFEQAITNEFAERIIRNLSDTFDINPISICYRLRELGFMPKENQATFSFG